MKQKEIEEIKNKINNNELTLGESNKILLDLLDVINSACRHYPCNHIEQGGRCLHNCNNYHAIKANL